MFRSEQAQEFFESDQDSEIRRVVADADARAQVKDQAVPDPPPHAGLDEVLLLPALPLLFAHDIDHDRGIGTDRLKDAA
jgi:hypothetical protein